MPIRSVRYVVREFLNLGITEISLSDTTGMANPRQVHEVCSELARDFPGVKWLLHFHNTRGMALANILTAMQAGVRHFDGSFAGLGGCPFAPGATGNVATEDIIHMCRLMKIETGVDIDKALKTAELAQSLIGRATESYLLKAGVVNYT